MKVLTSALMAVALIAGTTTCLTASAEDAPARANQRDRAGQIDSKTTGTNVRASQLIGHNIQNSQGKSVGEINDIVLDAHEGKIRYVAVTYGGFLGIGNKMFAVPYEAFQCKVDPNDLNETIVVLDVTQKQLEGAVGFDEDHWPNFADEKFTTQLDKRYGVDRTRRNRIRGVDVDVNRKGVDVDVNRNK